MAAHAEIFLKADEKWVQSAKKMTHFKVKEQEKRNLCLKT